MTSPAPTPSPAPLSAIPQVSAGIFEQADCYRERFTNAQPFKHVAMDDFFEPAFAERLLGEFPRFDPDLARNEMGKVAGKAVNTRIREISPAYRELYEMIGSKPFLELMSRISGIPGLILDPRMYGGGTHENLHGQELDPHIDFNYDEAQKLHRRLNVIVYLNKGWQEEWGGAIEVHSNPRDPEKNEIRAFNCIFNRCVMFETNEISWHGFPKINLPADKRDLSRKSISIYLYTTTRPAEEIAPLHGTFYVQRPLPARFCPGMPLTADDVSELKNLLWRRDIWVEHYQKMELEKNRELDAKSRDVQTMMANYAALTAEANAGAETARRNARAPITGYAVQIQNLGGYYDDRWTASRAELEFQPIVRVSGLRIRGWRPEQAPHATLRASVGNATAELPASGGEFTLDLRLPRDYREPFRLLLECEALPPISGDSRELAFLLVELRAMHPSWALVTEVHK